MPTLCQAGLTSSKVTRLSWAPAPFPAPSFLSSSSSEVSSPDESSPVAITESVDEASLKVWSITLRMNHHWSMKCHLKVWSITYVYEPSLKYAPSLKHKCHLKYEASLTYMNHHWSMKCHLKVWSITYVYEPSLKYAPSLKHKCHLKYEASLTYMNHHWSMKCHLSMRHEVSMRHQVWSSKYEASSMK